MQQKFSSYLTVTLTFSIIMINRLLRYGEGLLVYSENLLTHINTRDVYSLGARWGGGLLEGFER